MQLGYMGTNTNLEMVLKTQKSLYNQEATQKHTCQIFLPKTKPHNLKISNPENSIDHSLHLKSRVPPWGKDPFSSTCQQYKI